jgi:RNA polymerase sigma-70 factor (ECF subfamily)
MSRSEIDVIRENLLVLRAQARDEGAFSELVAQYERRVLYYVHRLLGDGDSADVMQEIWLRVFLQLPTLRAAGAFRAWLYKIAHDTAASHLRKRRRREIVAVAEEDLGDSTQTGDWNELELLERADLLHEALGRLSLPHREVLALRFLEELDLAEIAEVVGCSLGTVKSRLHYAKAALRTLLEASCRE